MIRKGVWWHLFAVNVKYLHSISIAYTPAFCFDNTASIQGSYLLIYVVLLRFLFNNNGSNSSFKIIRLYCLTYV